METSYFSLEEAQEVLPRVKYYLRKAMKLKKVLDLLNSIEIEYKDGYEFEEEGFTTQQKQFHKFSYDFYDAIEKLEEIGVVVKDLDEGLIDFLSIFEGREILLCYQFGETQIEYWHEIEEGYPGRRHIAELYAQ